jgi:hypothetical protein
MLHRTKYHSAPDCTKCAPHIVHEEQWGRLFVSLQRPTKVQMQLGIIYMKSNW